MDRHREGLLDGEPAGAREPYAAWSRAGHQHRAGPLVARAATFLTAAAVGGFFAALWLRIP